MIYTCKPSRVSIYVNTARKTAAQIMEETGCTALINGGLYNMGSFSPVCHLKSGGQVLAADEYKYWGFAWDTNNLQLATDYEKYENYICCVCLVRDGAKEPLYYNAALGGERPRTAIGVFPDGRVWMYASSEKNTPEQLQELALAAGVLHAIMLDGGGSTQCIFPDGKVSSSRKVHNFICVWAEDTQQVSGGDDTMFKIALGAGHGLMTAGKRCLKSLDPKETREWWLNDRICDYVESFLKNYEGYSLLRLDDSDDGADDIALSSRVKEANDFGADIYISVHHNAGINGGSGGGIVAYSYPNSATGAAWRDAMYDALINHNGLKGNRSQPKQTASFYVLKHTNMPAVLLELGFMDSKTDVPVILTDAYAQKCAKAIVEVLVEKGKLAQKAVAAEKDGTLYKVQVGAFSNKANAERLKAELTGKGYPAIIVKG